MLTPIKEQFVKPDHYRAGAFLLDPKEGIYTVCCVQCCAVIGTMQGIDLLRAIMRTAHRGGVLCPECRQRTCDICGLTYDTGQESKLTNCFMDPEWTARVCTICNLF